MKDFQPPFVAPELHRIIFSQLVRDVDASHVLDLLSVHRRRWDNQLPTKSRYPPHHLTVGLRGGSGGAQECNQLLVLPTDNPHLAMNMALYKYSAPHSGIQFAIQPAREILVVSLDSTGGPYALAHQLVEQIHIVEEIVYLKAMAPMLKPLP